MLIQASRKMRGKLAAKDTEIAELKEELKKRVSSHLETLDELKDCDERITAEYGHTVKLLRERAEAVEAREQELRGHDAWATVRLRRLGNAAKLVLEDNENLDRLVNLEQVYYGPDDSGAETKYLTDSQALQEKGGAA
jgi:hypothetical protein